jgi:hypothetical protein
MLYYLLNIITIYFNSNILHIQIHIFLFILFYIIFIQISCHFLFYKSIQLLYSSITFIHYILKHKTPNLSVSNSLKFIPHINSITNLFPIIMLKIPSLSKIKILIQQYITISNTKNKGKYQVNLIFNYALFQVIKA